MEIKTKFDVGQEVFFMHDNIVCKGTIERIKIEVIGFNEIKSVIQYKIHTYFPAPSRIKNLEDLLAEEDLFGNTGEVLTYLQNKFTEYFGEEN